MVLIRFWTKSLGWVLLGAAVVATVAAILFAPEINALRSAMGK
jgi:hypothetical protein